MTCVGTLQGVVEIWLINCLKTIKAYRRCLDRGFIINWLRWFRDHSLPWRKWIRVLPKINIGAQPCSRIILRILKSHAILVLYKLIFTLSHSQLWFVHHGFVIIIWCMHWRSHWALIEHRVLERISHNPFLLELLLFERYVFNNRRFSADWVKRVSHLIPILSPI